MNVLILTREQADFNDFEAKRAIFIQQQNEREQAIY